MESSEKNRSISKRNSKSKGEEAVGIYGIVKPGGYYFPGKISSGCFDGNGLIVDSRRKSQKEESEDIYGEFINEKYDPNGMYTGVNTDGGVPVQDADDL
jgi:hypothetical protein